MCWQKQQLPPGLLSPLPDMYKGGSAQWHCSSGTSALPALYFATASQHNNYHALVLFGCGCFSVRHEKTACEIFVNHRVIEYQVGATTTAHVHSYAFKQQINKIGENKPDILEQKIDFCLFMNEYADAAQDKWFFFCLFSWRVFYRKMLRNIPFWQVLKNSTSRFWGRPRSPVHTSLYSLCLRKYPNFRAHRENGIINKINKCIYSWGTQPV